MLLLLIVNTIILFVVAERLKPITGEMSYHINIKSLIKVFLLRRKIKIGDYFANVGYKDIEPFMMNEKIEEIIVVKNFGKKYVEVEVIEDRRNYTLPQPQTMNVKSKYITFRHLNDYYLPYKGASPAIKKIEFGKDIDKI
jgi:hypothetical protein